LRHPIYYHEGCCSPDTVAAMQESEADHPADIRQKLHFLIDPDETAKQENFVISVFLNSLQDRLSCGRYALTVCYGGKQEDYIKWKLLKTVAYTLPTSKKELVEAGIDPRIVKKYGDHILSVVADSIKGKEEKKTREDPALNHLKSRMQTVGPPMAAQADARLSDKRTDDATVRKAIPKGQADAKRHCQGIPAVVLFSRSTLY
jgi:hypothetical protein